MRTPPQHPLTACAMSALALSLHGCGDGGPGAADQPTGTVQHLAGGTDASILRSVVNLVSATGGCTGTVVGPRHVLTARHCVPHAPSGGPLMTTAVYAVDLTDPTHQRGTLLANGVASFQSFEADVAVLQVDRDLRVEPVRIGDEPMGDWLGRRVFAVGFGAGHAAGSFGAWLRIRDLTANQSWGYAERGDGGETICAGDSGGPDLAWLHGAWHVVGVHSGGATAAECALNARDGYSVRMDRVGPWVRSLVWGRASISAPRRYAGSRIGTTRGAMGSWQDLSVVTDAAGTRVVGYDGATLRTYWTAPASRGWTLGRVDAALADVSGDGRADLVYVDQTGAGALLSTSTPTAVSFDAAAVQLTPGPPSAGTFDLLLGDFDNNGRYELLVQNNVGASYVWTYSPASRSFANAGLVPGLDDSTRATLTVGDFDGDGADDVVEQDGAGATLFRGVAAAIPLAAGAALPAAWANGAASLVPVHTLRPNATYQYAAQGLLVSTSRGTQLYAATRSAAAPFAATGFNRADLLAGETAAVAGDFDADGYEDVLFARPDGAYAYRATGATPGLTPTSWARTDLRLHDTGFAALDMNADRRFDLWITRSEGSYGYLGSGTSAVFQANAWTATGLRLMEYAAW